MIQFFFACICIGPRKKVCYVIEDYLVIQSDRTLDIIVAPLFFISCYYYSIIVIVLQSDLFLLVACRRSAVLIILPVSHIIVLQEFRRKVLCKCLSDVLVEILISAPAFEAIQPESAEQRVVCRTAEGRIVDDLNISLVIADESDDLTVISLCGVSAVSSVCRPMGPCRIIFSLIRELCRKSPSQRIDLLCDPSCLPGILIPYIQVDEVHIVFSCRCVSRDLFHGRIQFAFRLSDILTFIPVAAVEVSLIDAVI